MATIKCAKCGQPVSTQANACPFCGYDASRWQCADCENFEETKYAFACRYCNKRSSDSACPGYVYAGGDDYYYADDDDDLWL